MESLNVAFTIIHSQKITNRLPSEWQLLSLITEHGDGEQEMKASHDGEDDDDDDDTYLG